MHTRRSILAFGMINADRVPLLGGKLADVFDQAFSTPAQGNEFDAIAIEAAEVFISRQARIKDQAFQRLAAMRFFPKVDEGQHLVTLIAMLDLGIAIGEDAGIGVLCQKG